jgi:hypothetical protein
MTADGLVPLEGVELYCDACGEFGHTFTSTNASGAYDFGREGIWMFPGSLATTILIHKDGYFDPGAGIGASGWSQRAVAIDGDTRFDVRLVRQ